MSDTTLETQVWTPHGPVSRGAILAQALLDLRDKIPAATLPAAEITGSKKATQDKVEGRTYTVQVTFHPAGESTVGIEDILADLQPEPFNPADHNDET